MDPRFLACSGFRLPTSFDFLAAQVFICEKGLFQLAARRLACGFARARLVAVWVPKF